MRVIKFAFLFLLFSLNANAMEVEMGTRLPYEIAGDFVLDENGRKTVIQGPWLIQSLSIINTDSTHILEIQDIEATASCLDGDNSEEATIHATFDIEYMKVQVPPDNMSFSTGEMYIHTLPPCKNGHIIKLSVSGNFLDENGDEADYDESSVTFITQ